MGIYRRGPRWYVRLWHKGREYRKSAGTIRRDAEELLGSLHRHLRQHGTFPSTSKMVLDFVTFLDRYYIPYVQKRWANYSNEECRIQSIRTAFGTKRIEEITTIELETYLTALRQDRSPSTVNRYAAHLKHMFNLACNWGFANKNPARVLKMAREPVSGGRYVTADEFQRLLAYLPDVYRPLAVTLAYTGTRLGEAIGLTWPDVDYDRGLIRVSGKIAKSRRERFVPLVEPVRQALERITARSTENPRVFMRPDGTPLTKEAFKTAWKMATRRSGVRARIHDLRHSLASWLAHAGAQEKVIQEVLGHSSMNMSARYTHIRMLDAKKVMEEVARSHRSHETGTETGTLKG